MNSGFSGHIEPADHFFKGLSMKQISQNGIPVLYGLKVALFLDERVVIFQNWFKTLVLDIYIIIS